MYKIPCGMFQGDNLNRKDNLMLKIWTNKDTLFDRIIVITDEAIITADLKEAELDDAKNRIESGEKPLNVLGKKATFIPFFEIKSIKIEESDDALEVEYVKENKSSSKTLAATDIEARKEMVSEIQSHLGSGFTSMTEKYNIPRAIFASLMTFSILAIITWLLHGAAVLIAAGTEAEFSGRNSGIKRLFYWVLDLLGPTGVLIIGGLLMLLAIMTLVKRIREPMIVTTLKEGKQRPGALFSTVIKYSILIGIWYLFAPNMIASLIS